MLKRSLIRNKSFKYCSTSLLAAIEKNQQDMWESSLEYTHSCIVSHETTLVQLNNNAAGTHKVEFEGIQDEIEELTKLLVE